jgi:hypothetical protein
VHSNTGSLRISGPPLCLAVGSFKSITVEVGESIVDEERGSSRLVVESPSLERKL